ncbi:Helix-turn-helix domain-containing protein [Geosporobacter subterraneus DSM 17957]|uniref:Helix-turn-helix domain-containing protein n=1 Tax=Geosporobacter subterraneus DSM 17957 TaxID=1121919 RepID=A0A1M6DTV6_9FIRM|nr:helix-turn-helix transcriptional regulator [Geosporobacter subterraneus]SHI76458.1 Helix-turn-helix domain-containing protein [Geosporobacter subterraneus DSM 17957]
MHGGTIKRRHAPYQKFKAFMVEHGIKQIELAKLLNKSVSALNQNLNGTGGDFSVAELRIICNKYNISADEFFIAQKVSKKKQN